MSDERLDHFQQCVRDGVTIYPHEAQELIDECRRLRGDPVRQAAQAVTEAARAWYEAGGGGSSPDGQLHRANRNLRRSVRSLAAALADPEAPQADANCGGDGACPADVHVHGCYSDRGSCDAPGEHLAGRVAVPVLEAQPERPVMGWDASQEVPPWASESVPDPDLFESSERFVAGALSTLPPFTTYHPAWCLPFARRAIESLGVWEPDDASGDDYASAWAVNVYAAAADRGEGETR